MSGEGAIRAHLATPEEERGAKWRHRFYDLIDITPLRERDPRIFTGPDGFPYYALDVPGAGEPGTILVTDLLELATERGFGIAIAPEGESAAWVFTYGDLVTRRALGSYEFPRVGVVATESPTFRAVLKQTQRMEILAPDDALLPSYVRPLLHQYFTRNLGIAHPGVLTLASPDQEPREQLVFRIARDDFADDDAFQRAIAGVTWFLPRHLVVSILPSEVLDALNAAFVPLAA
ncbi:hypothetical protein WPS_11650 [Vulcanimicrobium alpinum]|uniref:Uncharacterized protein n=1 Tax=Vulcanimicrobium alpinum TaxID=3016050 RepID=A0AAN1XVR9_UNVUL|nr:hypothetical protein [Vulcanimicrobium alpinum]BDE05889.1 hypothetical protein WPS_11650 [Vulcanimicrobium alpinum]